MAQVRLHGHSQLYGIADVLRLFYGLVSDRADDWLQAGSAEPIVHSSCQPCGKDASQVLVHTWAEGISGQQGALQKRVPEADARREIKRQLYQLLSGITGIAFPWGSLTGIRPTQVVWKLLNAPAAPANLHSARVGLVERLTADWGLLPDKAELAVTTAAAEQSELARHDPIRPLVYLGVPFCPSRCAYCSFITRDAPAQGRLMEMFATDAAAELEAFFSRVPAVCGSFYLGGGTPTSLPAVLLDRLLQAAKQTIPGLAECEKTVEAGRPDTLDAERLAVLRSFGVTRLCINPQTFSDQTLDRIGRRHTTADTLSAYRMAREMGFSNINMDLIAGLPGETPADLERSVRTGLDLRPESITLHALAIKRTSRLHSNWQTGQEEMDRSALLPNPELTAAVAMAHRLLMANGYQPYYLYRQKDAVGGLENVGFALPGHACYYNVGMMSDQRHVIGFGCGAVSKRIFGSRLERLPNPREPAVYHQRLADLCTRKIDFFTANTEPADMLNY